MISSPIEDRERAYPTSRKSGLINRSHLVWNRAHPDDLVQPGEEVHHKNDIKDDDRIENLKKCANHQEHMQLHAAERSGPYATITRDCRYCGVPFKAHTHGSICSAKSCRERQTREQKDRTNLALKEGRAEASAHPCCVCGATIHARAKYCKEPACQRVRNSEKCRRWAMKPENAARLREYDRGRRKAKKAD